MIPSPSPQPLDVIVHAAPAAAWQVWAAFAPLLAAIVAALIAAAALWQKHRSDNRAEWWRRAQWALDASMSDQPSRAEMGMQAINILGKSKLATAEDGKLLKIGTEDPLEDAYRAQFAETVAAAYSAAAAGVDSPGPGRDNEEDHDDNEGR